jgi:hypothetical protein
LQWPALSAFCGLKPWDADPDNPGCLTYGEVHVYLSALRERAEEMARQEAAMNERR